MVERKKTRIFIVALLAVYISSFFAVLLPPQSASALTQADCNVLNGKTAIEIATKMSGAASVKLRDDCVAANYCVENLAQGKYECPPSGTTATPTPTPAAVTPADCAVLQGQSKGWGNPDLENKCAAANYCTPVTTGGVSAGGGGGPSGTVGTTANVVWSCNGVAVAGSNPTPTTVTPSTGASTGPAQSTCVIEAVGWIVCPVTEFLAKVVDAAYGMVSAMLEFNGFTSTNGSTSLKSAWEVMRNIANVVFVIAFIIIVISQVTSMGISNYGIKKLLPKLIIAAILVNISYTVCAIAADLSNLLGAGAKGIFDNIKFAAPSAGDWGGSGNGWQGIVGPLLAGTLLAGAALYIGLSAFIPAILAALIAIITAVLVLTLRQALLILLIVVSPLAFVALLLPNTESWFKKWRELFTTLLLMYPIIGLIFGASALASKIVMAGASGDMKIIIQIMGALIAVIPLAITPILMKVSGGVLGRFGGMINNPNKGPFDRLRKRGDQISEDQRGKRALRALNGNGKVFGGGQFRRAARRDAISEGIKKEQQRARSGYIANQVQGNERFRNRVAGGSSSRFMPASDEAMSRALRDANFTIDKVEAEEVQAAAVELKGMTVESIVKRATTGRGEVKDENGNVVSTYELTEAQKMAAIDLGMQKGGFSQRREIVESSGNYDPSKAGDQKILQRIADGVYSKGDQGIYGVGIGDQILQGKINESSLRAATQQNIVDGNVDGKHMVHSQSATKYMVDIARGEINGGAAAYTGPVPTDPNTRRILSDAIIEAMAGEETKIAAAGKAYQDQYTRI